MLLWPSLLREVAEAKAPKTFMQSKADIRYRIKATEHKMARMFFGGEAFPCFDTEIAPGDLALYLGSGPFFQENTKVVWHRPSISDPDKANPLTFSPNSKWWKFHRRLIAEAVRHGQGRFLVGVPDLIEGLDTLASLRGTTGLALDLFRRPKWVHARLGEITDLYLTYFDAIHRMIRDELDGNAYSILRIWGPGRTAKVQCDFSAIISPAMFREFALPYLGEQWDRLDFTPYHLDGTPRSNPADSRAKRHTVGAWSGQSPS